MQRLTDQVAIVTGGAQGVGRGIASVLAAEGARVVIADVDGALAESTATAFRTDGRETFAVTADVTDRASVEAMAARVVAEHGRIDILAANAGVYPSASIDAIDDALWDRVMDINVKGARPRHPGLHADDGCSGVRPSRSDVLDHGARDRPGRFRALRRLEGGHARLHALCGCRARDAAASRSTQSSPGTSRPRASPTRATSTDDRCCSSIPMGRYADPEDVGWAVRFLASPEAGYITGQTLIVDGGQVLPEGSTLTHRD